ILTQRLRHPRALPSFPTRRSSDLSARADASTSRLTTVTSPKRQIDLCILPSRFMGRTRRPVPRQDTADAEEERLPNGGEVAVKRSEEHTSELQSLTNLVCRLLLDK